MTKRRVLIVYRSYFPSQSHLGPATAIRNLVTNLAHQYDFHILTLNYDFAKKQPLFKQRHHTVVRDNVTVEYVAPGLHALSILRQRLNEAFDAVDIHCAFDPLLSIPALLMTRLGLARGSRVFHTPHGIFMDTIMSTRPNRKRAFCWAADSFGLYRNITHLAGSTAEQRDIEMRHRTLQNVCVTSQFVQFGSPTNMQRTKSRERLKIAFVGRVTTQKNLMYAIDVVSRLTVPSTLDVFGDTDDHAYFSRCLEKTKLGAGQCSINFAGSIEKADLYQALGNYDVLFHPTLGENFGHAIVESLSLGLPVLGSDRSPWIDLAAHNAGWSLPLANQEAFVEKLESLYAMGDEWTRLSSGASSYARKTFDHSETASRYRAAYG